MITARLPGRAAFAARLAAEAERLSAAYAETRALERRGDPGRWRRADLLWPLITRSP